ncbi:TonB-dependent receptor [Rufibacter quisquiliarum]|uniref:Iron complex outermembrane receptor protein n=1 Tax=Rufibacter quisquiliarum TaxID=1549639 RepID=A0A839GYA9_9BACT|nr:TonB-dependent receptor [Rufibacter quisquiliarum]MBA9079807.1 iron complex outermembrane receptor protein [Rufibacter quisquiliarum]
MRNYSNYFVLLLLCVCLPFPAVFAQNGPVPAGADALSDTDCGITLSGTVTDHEDRTPLIGATVLLDGTQLTSVTDANGHYHFHGLCPGTYTLVVSYIGYTTERLQKAVRAPEVLNFRLHPDGLLLHSVEVRAARQRTQITQATGQLNGRELAQTHGQSLAQSLERITGLSSIQTGPSIAKPVIHGMHSNRILVMNNGVRHEAQQWGSEHAPEIDPFVASELTVVKGAAGVRYGADAIGGVILVEPKPLRDSAGTSAVLNLVGVSHNRQGVVSGMVESNPAGIPSLSWRLQGTLKKAGNSKTPDYYLANTGYQEQNFSAAAGWTRDQFGVDAYFSRFDTKLGVFSASHVGNLTDIRNALQRERPEPEADFTYTIGVPYQNVTHDLLRLHGFYKTGTASRLLFTYARQYNIREEFDAHGDQSRPGLRFEITTHSTEVVWEHPLVHNLKGSLGATYQYQFNRYEGRFFVPFYQSHTGGLFWLEEWEKGKWHVEAGVRYDYRHLQAKLYRKDTPQRTGQSELDNQLLTPTHTWQNLSGTLGAIYHFGPHLDLNLNASTAWRSPTTSELYSNGIHHGTGTYEYGNANLGMERAYNLVATLAYVQNKRLNGEISVYRNYIDNYIYQEPDTVPTLTIRGAFLTARQKQADATFTGLDVSASYQLTDHLLLATKASLVRAYNQTADEYLIWIPSDRYENSLRYSIGKLGARGVFAQNFIQISGLAVARQKNVPDNYLARDYALPPAGYFLLNAEAGTTLQLGQQQIEIGLIGRNLLNTAYRDYLNRFRYYADETGRSITLRVSIPLNF